MLDLINPWGALRRARQLIVELVVDIENLEREVEDDYIAYTDLAQRFELAEELIAQGHFRNPKTGRIGPKGKTFQ